MFKAACSASLFLAAIASLLTLPAKAQDTFLTIDDAGPDYAIQGEYVGDIQREGNAIKIGLQVVALGNHKFDAVVYPGGLPGDGWIGGEKERAQGETIDGETKIVSDQRGHAIIKDGKAVLYS